MIIPERIAQDPQLLVRTLAETRVSRIVLVPPMLRAMLDVAPVLQAQLPKLTFWSLSGERLSKPLLDRARASLPNSVILNLYGSTEVAADVTFFDTRDNASSCVPIGRPILQHADLHSGFSITADADWSDGRDLRWRRCVGTWIS